MAVFIPLPVELLPTAEAVRSDGWIQARALETKNFRFSMLTNTNPPKTTTFEAVEKTSKIE